MTQELKAYLGLETKVSAAFNFFINGMISSLIYHKADSVGTDPLSLGVDFALTCLLMFILTALFCRTSLKRTNTLGILPPSSSIMRKLSRSFRYPVLFGLVAGLAAAAVLFLLASLVLAELGIKSIPFGLYIALKTTGCALLGGSAALAHLYTGLFRAE